ncbi:MAG: hypothetical protein JW954_08525 [Dehalococcoidaceae bacterium]|nr:hypothetical protein [Dehalococcoidaceae bacterium]
MGDELEQENESRPQDPGENEEQPVEEKNIENNPDLEDPRLYSPLLGSNCPGFKDRMGEEHAECVKEENDSALNDPVVEEQPETPSAEENPDNKAGSPADNKDRAEPENHNG